MIKNPKILVTGATGFIGSHLLVKLIDLNFEVMAIARKNGPDLGKNLSWLASDIASLDEIKDKIQKFRPEVVVHLAWQGIPDYSLETSQLNLDISRDFLTYLSQLNSCKKIIVSGSCWEYGKDNGICKEKDVSIANNHFTWAKNSLREHLKIACETEDVDLVWFRIFFSYGPSQRKGSLIPSILSALENKTLPDINTPYNSNDFIFVEDVVMAFVKAITTKIPVGIYNLGSGKATSIIDVCRIAEQTILGNHNLTDSMSFKNRETSSAVNFWACTKKAEKYLSWQTEVTLEEGIERTIQVLLK